MVCGAKGLVRGKTALSVHNERISGAFFFDGEKSLVGLRGVSAVQAFAGSALIIINGGQEVVAGDAVEEDRSSFAAALQANIELRRSLRERSASRYARPISKWPSQVSASFCASRKELRASRALPFLSCTSPAISFA